MHLLTICHLFSWIIVWHSLYLSLSHSRANINLYRPVFMCVYTRSCQKYSADIHKEILSVTVHATSIYSVTLVAKLSRNHRNIYVHKANNVLYFWITALYSFSVLDFEVMQSVAYFIVGWSTHPLYEKKSKPNYERLIPWLM